MVGPILPRRTFLSFSAGALACAALSTRAQSSSLAVKRDVFGKMPSGQEVQLFTLSNGTIEAKVMTLGATLVTVRTPDKAGKLDDITLHLDTLEDYVKGHPLFGSTVGRFAN